MDKKWVVIALSMLIISNILWIYEYQTRSKISGSVSFFDFLFGSSSSVAQLFVQVVIAPPNITIDSPLNTTYTFNQSQTYDIALNVSADKTIQTWWYRLYNASGAAVSSNVIFTPNTTFTAVLGSNTLAVFANISSGQTGNRNVTFSVRIASSAPEIMNLSQSVLACEDSFLSYRFNITDADEETVTVSMTPVNPFFITKVSQTGNLTIAEIFSGTLTKAQVGNYSENVSASDGTRADSKQTNITAIPVNHAPLMERMGVQTIWFNDNLTRRPNANDTEDGNVTEGNLTFNITFTSGNAIFSINSTTGLINYTANSSAVGVYNTSVCVTDRGLNTTVYPNASYCGYSGSASYNCTNYQLTITNQNRAPNITNYYPSGLSINAPAVPYSYTFNVTATDPDGTTPDVEWIVNGDSIQTSSSPSQFNRTFVSGGTYNVTARATDGELNSSVSWTVIIPSAPSTSAGGGGGGSGGECVEKWACDDTAVCQDPDVLYRQRLLDDLAKGVIEVKCKYLGWNEKECGIKLLNCQDVNRCGTYSKKPNQTEACYFVENPSCNDGVKNCHDNACEVLVDCGGPCGTCPTCSDRIQNQNEQGIDCGGPCPNACPIEQPKKTNYFIYVLILIILALVGAIGFTIYKLFAVKKKIEESQ